MTASRDILADRLNTEPAIFRGCSSSELGVIVGVAALVWVPLSLVLAWMLGAITMGLGLAGVGIVVTVVVTATVFQRLKRGRPDGFYQQQFLLWLSAHGLRRSPFIRRSGAWSMGRTGQRNEFDPARGRAHAPLSLRD